MKRNIIEDILFGLQVVILNAIKVAIKLVLFMIIGIVFGFGFAVGENIPYFSENIPFNCW